MPTSGSPLGAARPAVSLRAREALASELRRIIRQHVGQLPHDEDLKLASILACYWKRSNEQEEQATWDSVMEDDYDYVDGMELVEDLLEDAAGLTSVDEFDVLAYAENSALRRELLRACERPELNWAIAAYHPTVPATLAHELHHAASKALRSARHLRRATACPRTRARARGAGRPRVRVSGRSSAASGDSGDGEPGSSPRRPAAARLTRGAA
jgi:hypothetical protein